MRNAKCGIRNTTPFLIAASLLFLFCASAAFAEIKVIEADSTYVMGDNDSKVDARRIATQEAKRKALELAGTYVESLTEVKNEQLSRDEVKAYTAGVIETEIVADETRGSVQHPEIYIKARCKVDTAQLALQIDRFRESEELKEQLTASAKENEALRKERDGLVMQLAAEKDKANAETTRQKLDTVLSKEEANDQTKTVWINIGQQLVEVDESSREIKQAELDKSAVILRRAVALDPQNQQARYLLAAVYEHSGNQSAAESELQTAIQHNPSNPEPHMRLGIVLKNQGRYEEALKEFHFVERIRPHNPMMLFYTGMTLKELNRCGRTVEYLLKFLDTPRSRLFPKKRELAAQRIRECGGGRGGYQRRVRYQQ